MFRLKYYSSFSFHIDLLTRTLNKSYVYYTKKKKKILLETYFIFRSPARNLKKFINKFFATEFRSCQPCVVLFSVTEPADTELHGTFPPLRALHVDNLFNLRIKKQVGSHIIFIINWLTKHIKTSYPSRDIILNLKKVSKMQANHMTVLSTWKKEYHCWHKI